jgi:alkane 1-monooxygenase
MPVYVYALALVPGIIALVGPFIGGAAPLAVPLLLFGLVPLIEVFTKPSGHNLETATEARRRHSHAPDALLLLIVPLQYGLVLAMMSQVSSGALTGWALPGAVLAAGIPCAAYGINVAHELGHRRTRLHRGASKMLLLSTLYLHFFIEHNRGHHARVATPEDPASARRGENIYAFWLRSVSGSWASAWALEDKRLKGHAHPRMTLSNQMTRFTLIQIAALGIALTIFGPLATTCWVGSSIVGFLLLETVNYIEHYGLVRKRQANGRYERVQLHHSWNSDLPLGRALLFELTRHSDHHAHPARSYTILRHFEAAPQLPTGYPGMVLLALFPPLFYRVMDRQLADESERLHQAA